MVKQFGQQVVKQEPTSTDVLASKLDALLVKLDALFGQLSSVAEEWNALFAPLRAYDTSAGTGLTVVLDTQETGGRLHVEVWVKSSGPASFDVAGSHDGVEYRLVDTIILNAAGETHRGYENAYRCVRVSTTARNNNAIEIVASR